MKVLPFNVLLREKCRLQFGQLDLASATGAARALSVHER